MKNRLVFNITTIVLAVIYVIALILGDVFYTSTEVIAKPGSYAESLAKEKGIEVYNLSDSNEGMFFERYETFEYNYEPEGIFIEQYLGEGTEVVIPSRIEGIEVVGIGKDFLDLSPQITDLYVPDTLLFIDFKPSENFVFHCTDDNWFKNLFLVPVEEQEKKTDAEDVDVDADSDDNDTEESEPEEIWMVEPIYDSEYIMFNLGDLKFSYNISGKEVAITGYFGDSRDITLPAYINGLPVTSVSMDFNLYDSVVFPSSIKNIDGNFSDVYFSYALVLEILFSAIAILLSLILVNVVLSRYKNAKGYNVNSKQMVSIYVYLVGQMVFGVLEVYEFVCSLRVAWIISLVWLSLFVLVFVLLGVGRRQLETIEKRNAKSTDYFNEIKIKYSSLADGVEDDECYKLLKKVVEEMKYSTPKSYAETEEVEEEINILLSKLQNAVNENQNDAILSIGNEAIKKIKFRNAIVKTK